MPAIRCHRCGVGKVAGRLREPRTPSRQPPFSRPITASIRWFMSGALSMPRPARDVPGVIPRAATLGRGYAWFGRRSARPYRRLDPGNRREPTQFSAAPRPRNGQEISRIDSTSRPIPAPTIANTKAAVANHDQS